MKLISQILSNVQTDVNDIGGQRIQLAEYIDYAQRVADEIAYKLEIWITYINMVPNPSLNPVMPAPSTLVIPPAFRAVQLLRVRRNGKEAQEFSRQAAGKMASDNFAFDINSVQLEGADFWSTITQTEEMQLTFVTPFQADEEVYLEFMTGRPYDFQMWTQNTSIPDFLVDTVEYGIKMRVFERLYNSGVEGMKQRLDRAEMKYQRAFAASNAYTKNFHDKRSPVVRQPYKFLSDEIEHYYRIV